MFQRLLKKNKTQRKIDKNLGVPYANIDAYFPIDDSCRKMISRVKNEYQLPDINLRISKYDLMFLNTLIDYSLAQSYKAYIKTGLNARNIVVKGALATFGELNNINNILDFASGYGRLTRHLLHDFNPNKIWVSDIKIEAVEFQKEEFLVNGILSSFNPEDFNPPVKFDLIFVGSLFSHLPQPLFEQWMIKLSSLLSNNGLFILTTLNAGFHRPDSANDFDYVETSEDKMLNFVNGAIVQDDVYGMAFVSDDYMKNQIAQLKWMDDRYSVNRNGFGRRQDVYMVTKKWNNDLENIDLTQYP